MARVHGELLGAVVAVACLGGCGPPATAGDVVAFNAGVQARGPPPYACGPTGSATQRVMASLDAFWNSAVTACSCLGDAPAICSGGGFVSGDPGYVYYDPQALNLLDQYTGSVLPADMVMAHEFGHTIQLWYALPVSGALRELQADCFAGFYVGSRIAAGTATSADVASTFQTACSYGDPYLKAWFEPGAHGSCVDRVSSIQRGIAGYLGGAPPFAACQ